MKYQVPSNLNNLKRKVDKFVIGKIETTPVDLSKLSDAGKMKLLITSEYDELVKEDNNNTTTDTSTLVKKTD